MLETQNYVNVRPYTPQKKANFSATQSGVVTGAVLGGCATAGLYSISGKMLKNINQLPLNQKKLAISEFKSILNSSRIVKGKAPISKTLSKTLKTNMKNPVKILKTFVKYAKYPVLIGAGIGLTIDLVKNMLSRES